MSKCSTRTKLGLMIFVIVLLLPSCFYANNNEPQSAKPMTTQVVEKEPMKQIENDNVDKTHEIKPIMIPFADVNGKFGYMDKVGNILIKPIYDNADRFSQGVARVGIDDKIGYIDSLGNIVIEVIYSAGEQKRDGIITVYRVNNEKKDSGGVETLYLDEKGKPLLLLDSYYYAGIFSQDYIKIRKNSDSKMSFVDIEGKAFLEQKFDTVKDFCENKSAICNKNEWGYININGDVIISDLEYASDFSEGLAAVKKDGLWGYIDESGEFILTFPKLKEMDSLSKFENGKAFITFNNLIGIIDKKGNILVEPKFSGVSYIYEDIIGVYNENENFLHYETFDGEIITPVK